ncbi:hypothetical protein [Streptomyces sp. NPDC058847]
MAEDETAFASHTALGAQWAATSVDTRSGTPARRMSDCAAAST